VSIDHPEELAALRAAGRVVAETLRELARRVRPGVTTAELDAVAAGVFARHGARSGPQLDYDFPGAICISLDDECVHTASLRSSPASPRPGPRRLREGQLVKLDVTAELDGFYADACRTVAVGRVRGREQRLAAAAQSALRRGLEAASAGNNVGAIGAAVQAEVERRGVSVCGELTGHGIGRRIHEEPEVPNVAWDGPELTAGLVITIEPIIAAGSGDVHLTDDGWTVCTGDGSASAHAEHTIVITEAAPLLVTA
jgi:methionyl aminopeptidase